MRTPLLRSALFATLAATSFLAACGYTPLYAPGAGSADAASRVQIGDVVMSHPLNNVGERRVAQTLSQQLKLDFPESSIDMDTVAITINEASDNLAVQRTAIVQRVQITLEAHIILTDPNGHKLLDTTTNTTVPYNVQDTPYSTESSKTFARLTGARNLADEVSRRLYLFYSTHKNAGGVTPLTPPAKFPPAPAGQ